MSGVKMTCFAATAAAAIVAAAAAAAAPLPSNGIFPCHAAPTTAACFGFPPDPDYGIMFCPDNGNVGAWLQGTRCSADCQYGILDSDQKPYVICQSRGNWSDIVGLCKPPCQLPPALCP